VSRPHLQKSAGIETLGDAFEAAVLFHTNLPPAHRRRILLKALQNCLSCARLLLQVAILSVERF
jgi:hypothetical protein